MVFWYQGDFLPVQDQIILVCCGYTNELQLHIEASCVDKVGKKKDFDL